MTWPPLSEEQFFLRRRYLEGENYQYPYASVARIVRTQTSIGRREETFNCILPKNWTLV